MATCGQTVTELLSNNTSIEIIDNTTLYDFNIDANNNKIFALNLDTNQTVYFKPKIIGFTSSTVFITIIKKSDMSIAASSKFNKDTVLDFILNEDEYYVCFRIVFGTVNLNLTVEYLRFSRKVSFDNIQCGVGSSFSGNIKFAKKAVACSQPLRYKMIAGELPTGLKMDSSGRIYGTLPILDDEDKKDFPTYNLYQDDIDEVDPIGVRYEFTVRLELYNDPDVFDIRKFCLLVVNDWDLTEPFLVFEEQEDIGFVDVDGNLLDELCPPCDEYDDKKDLYKFNKFKSITKINDSVTGNNFISKAPFIHNKYEINYAVEKYINEEKDIFVPSSENYVDMSESIMLPGDVAVNQAIYWIRNNYEELLLDGYGEKALNSYINKLDNVEVSTSKINDRYYVHIEFKPDNDLTDSNMLYNLERQDILRNEPIYTKMVAGITMEVDLC